METHVTVNVTTEVVPFPQPGEFWQHFKGGVYEILTLAMNAADETDLVVYRSKSGIWVRPLSEFVEELHRGEFKGPRFRKLVGHTTLTPERIRELLEAAIPGAQELDKRLKRIFTPPGCI